MVWKKWITYNYQNKIFFSPFPRAGSNAHTRPHAHTHARIHALTTTKREEEWSLKHPYIKSYHLLCLRNAASSARSSKPIEKNKSRFYCLPFWFRRWKWDEKSTNHTRSYDMWSQKWPISVAPSMALQNSANRARKRDTYKFSECLIATLDC